MLHKSDIAALVSARICHDLISPIGAIGNGIELIMLERPAVSAELDLISQSVTQASARIRFFRLAYGSGSTDQRIARSEVIATLQGLSHNNRVKVIFQSPAELARSEVKLIFLLLQCLEATMPWGGQVEIINDGESWQLTAQSARLRNTPELWQELLSEEGPHNPLPTSIQFALAWQELRRWGKRLTYQPQDEAIILRL